MNGSIYSQSEHTLDVNEAGGRIIGSDQYAAISYNIGALGIDTPDAKLGGVAFVGADGDDRLVNRGTMRGDIDRRSGNDMFDTRKGTLQGAISCGAGSDILVTDNAGYHMLEKAGERNDTVRSSVSYANVEILTLVGSKNINGSGTALGDELPGNGGDNVLRGKAGGDRLDGGHDDDRLIGALVTTSSSLPQASAMT